MRVSHDASASHFIEHAFRDTLVAARKQATAAGETAGIDGATSDVLTPLADGMPGGGALLGAGAMRPELVKFLTFVANGLAGAEEPGPATANADAAAQSDTANAAPAPGPSSALARSFGDLLAALPPPDSTAADAAPIAGAANDEPVQLLQQMVGQNLGRFRTLDGFTQSFLTVAREFVSLRVAFRGPDAAAASAGPQQSAVDPTDFELMKYLRLLRHSLGSGPRSGRKASLVQVRAATREPVVSAPADAADSSTTPLLPHFLDENAVVTPPTAMRSAPLRPSAGFADPYGQTTRNTYLEAANRAYHQVLNPRESQLRLWL